MKRYWSQLGGLPILAEGSAQTLATLSGLFLDPEKGKILAFRAGFSRVFSPLDVVSWHSNRVQIADAEALTPPDEISRLAHFGYGRCFVLSKKVLSKSGQNLGRVDDLCLDTSSASLLSFDVSKRFLLWHWERRSFSFSDIQEITDKAVILKMEPLQKQKSKAVDSLKNSVPLGSMGTASTRDAS